VRSEDGSVGSVLDPRQVGRLSDELLSGHALDVVPEAATLEDVALPEGPVRERAVVDRLGQRVERQETVACEQGTRAADLEAAPCLDEGSTGRVDAQAPAQPMLGGEREGTANAERPDLRDETGQKGCEEQGERP
jgi:hypothetical protein